MSQTRTFIIRTSDRNQKTFFIRSADGALLSSRAIVNRCRFALCCFVRGLIGSHKRRESRRMVGLGREKVHRRLKWRDDESLKVRSWGMQVRAFGGWTCGFKQSNCETEWREMKVWNLENFFLTQNSDPFTVCWQTEWEINSSARERNQFIVKLTWPISRRSRLMPAFYCSPLAVSASSRA